jgi:predicted nucleotidyltransferase
MRAIQAITDHIAEIFDPEQIILFGSYAYGKPTAGSDVDLLVVMDTPAGKEFEKSLDIRKSLPVLTFGLDVVVRSRKDIDRRKQLGDWFLVDATEKGKVLYERSHRRVDHQGR